MAVYNSKGIFTNARDDLQGLKQVLFASFSRSDVEIVGCDALFYGEM